MVARGVLYAVSDDHEAQMISRAGRQQELVDYLDALFDEDWLVDIDKIWDEMHRALGNGELDYGFADPLQGIILGGRLLSVEDWFIVVHKDAKDVRAIANAASDLSDDEFRERYDANVDEFDVLAGREDTVQAFRVVREFYRKAADDGRAVIFAVDQ